MSNRGRLGLVATRDNEDAFCMTRIAIIGAGVAGLTVDYALRTHPVERTVFEKSRGYGGRAATRGREGCWYDHGAPFFAAPSPRVRDQVTAHLPSEQLIKIGRPVGGFNGDGDLLRRSEPDEGPRWTYNHGISTLGKLLARFSRAEVARDTHIDHLERTDVRWHLRTKSGASFGPYDAVVLTAPAPQTASILGSSPPSISFLTAVSEAVSEIGYTSQFSYILAYNRPVRRPLSAHGPVSEDDDHPLAWIGFEQDKPCHVRSGTELIVVHTAPTWTAGRVDRDPETFLPDVEAHLPDLKAQAADVLGAGLDQPVWYDTQRWRYARPQAGLPAEI